MSAPSLQEYRARPAHPARRAGGLRVRGGGHGQPTAKATGGTAQEPLLSVVTVVYNGQGTLERAIRSVTGQTYPHVEYILVDGGSTDGTLEIIRRYEDRIACWISEPDAGIFDAMNKGVALASGSYVAVLNCDDHYLPGALQHVARALKESAADAAYGDSVFVVEDVGLEGRVTATLDLARGMTLCHPALFVAKPVYERLGAYDTWYRFSSDFDLALRLQQAGVRFAQVDEPLVRYSAGGAAEQNLVRASCEAMLILKRQAGLLCALRYGLMFLKRAVLRGINGCVRVLLGRRAYLWMKRRYYTAKGFTPIANSQEGYPLDSTRPKR